MKFIPYSFATMSPEERIVFRFGGLRIIILLALETFAAGAESSPSDLWGSISELPLGSACSLAARVFGSIRGSAQGTVLEVGVELVEAAVEGVVCGNFGGVVLVLPALHLFGKFGPNLLPVVKRGRYAGTFGVHAVEQFCVKFAFRHLLV